jgi:transcriptional regulator with XRE-family HTH domain
MSQDDKNPMTLQEKIGLNIKQFRQNKGLTQADVADKTDINTNTYAKIERGVQTASTPMLQDIASTLGVELFELFVFKK